jgi:hypothetical protein
MYCWIYLPTYRQVKGKGGGNNSNYQRETVGGQRFFSFFLFCKMWLNHFALIEI